MDFKPFNPRVRRFSPALLLPVRARWTPRGLPSGTTVPADPHTTTFRIGGLITFFLLKRGSYVEPSLARTIMKEGKDLRPHNGLK